MKKTVTRSLPHDGHYYVDLNGFDRMVDALLYAALLQYNGEQRSIPIYQHGTIVRFKRF